MPERCTQGLPEQAVWRKWIPDKTNNFVSVPVAVGGAGTHLEPGLPVGLIETLTTYHCSSEGRALQKGSLQNPASLEQVAQRLCILLLGDLQIRLDVDLGTKCP